MDAFSLDLMGGWVDRLAHDHTAKLGSASLKSGNMFYDEYFMFFVMNPRKRCSIANSCHETITLPSLPCPGARLIVSRVVVMVGARLLVRVCVSPAYRITP